jgi:hypothetical protein
MSGNERHAASRQCSLQACVFLGASEYTFPVPARPSSGHRQDSSWPLPKYRDRVGVWRFINQGVCWSICFHLDIRGASNTASVALARWGIETSIIVSGAFTRGTNHFAHAGTPADKSRAEEYDSGPYKHFSGNIMKGFSSIVPPDADVTAVAGAIAKVVDTPFRKRQFRVHVDPTQDGAEVVNMVSDRLRTEFLRRIDLSDL